MYEQDAGDLRFLLTLFTQLTERQHVCSYSTRRQGPSGAIGSRDRGLGSPIRPGTHPTEILVHVEEYVRPGINVASCSHVNPNEGQEHLRRLETAGTRHHRGPAESSDG